MVTANRTTRTQWQRGIDQELAFWRRYLASGGLNWPDEFRFRMDPDAPLQPHIAARLPAGLPTAELPILDCAAGPATTLGKTLNGDRLPITAIDALAEQYHTILEELHLQPPVPSLPCTVEALATRFGPDRFALVYMRFALDHCYDPIAALHQMVRVARPGCAVMIEHYRGEHDEEYHGLKHWTLEPATGDLIIRNEGCRLSVASELPEVNLELDSSPSWLTLILRKP
ncbi:MAG TPA: methyltransferase domain-containing protein [Chloroflexota bacterium]|nr:methyltransferase domain-containing protein [Chloroflexota bacterium]